MEFTKNGLELCGKKFKFKKCTNKQLLEHQQSIEAQLEQYKKLFDKGKQLEKDIELLDAQIVSIGNIIKAIQDKQEPSDDELSMIIKKSDEQFKLIEKRQKLVLDAEKLDKDHTKELKEIEAYIVEQYGELASLQLEGLTAEFFVENCTSADMTIVRLLGSIRKMLSLGASSRDVEKFVKQNVLEEANQPFQN